jgi:uncharacterized protein YxeA
MVQRGLIYVIELVVQSIYFVKLMQVHREFYLIDLQSVYQDHEKEEHEHKLLASTEVTLSR